MKIELQLTIYEDKAEIALPSSLSCLIKILQSLEDDYQKVMFENDKMILYNYDEDLDQEKFTERNCS